MINISNAFVDKWVFDSNLERAMPLTKETLDWCVSSNNEKTKYKRYYWVIRLLPSPPSYGNLMNADGRRIEAPTIQNNLAALMEIIEEQDAFHSMRNSSPSLLSWQELSTKLATKSFKTVLSSDGPFYTNEHLKK